MMRTWNLLGLSALTTLLLVTRAPAGGQPTDGVIPQDAPLTKAHLDALEKRFLSEFKKISDAFQVTKKRLDTLEGNDAFTRLKLTEAQIQNDQLKKQVDQLRLDMETLQKRLPSKGLAFYPPEDKADLDKIASRLTQIERTLRQMQAGPNRTANYPPGASTGRIVLANHYTPDSYLLFIINQKSYRVLSGQTATIDNMPAGTFTYEVISPTSGSPRGIQSRTLEPGETYTLTARP